jgi:hypothetical protein
LQVRAQLAGETFKTGDTKPTLAVVSRSILASKGVRGFFDGMSAAYLRQMSYGTSRLTLYDYLKSKCLPEGSSSGFGFKAGIGLASGALAALLSCPVEVSLVRMQVDAAFRMSRI